MNEENRIFIKDVERRVKTYFPCISHEVAAFIACQFALESDFGRSNLAKNQNNFCGMRMPLVRITTAYRGSIKNDFATYDDLDDCVYDYFLCLQYHQPLRRELEYLNFFKGFIKWYCPEKDYINKITNLFNLYQDGKEN